MRSKQAMSPKEKRMLKAHRLRYMQDMNLQQVADELGMSYSTVRKYFSSDEAQRFKEFFSEEERQFLQVQLKQMAEEATRNALSYISDGKTIAENSNHYARLAKEERETVKDAIEMSQQLGLVPKPKERKEVEQKSTDVTISEGVVDPDNLSDEVRERLEAENSE